jgi:(2Fe-2S) ferredoxin
MPPPYERHIFVCTNRRPEDDPRGCCAAKGGEAVHKALKAEVAAKGLKGRVRANSSGCLDACAFGVAVVVYPEGIWYRGVTVADVPEIVQKTLIDGERIERLAMPMRPSRTPDASQG